MDEKEEITRQTVQKLHGEQMLNGIRHERIESEIVDILGGIDDILSTYLDESNHILLTNDQISRLYALLKTPTPYQHKNKAILFQDIVDNEQGYNGQFSYTFDVNHTILHSVFSTKNAQKIKHFIDQKIILVLIIIEIIIALCIRISLGERSLIRNIYNIVMFSLLLVLWLILKNFSLNKTGFILLLKTFDFWIKVCYGIIITVADIFISGSSSEHDHILIILRQTTFGAFIVLSVCYVAAFDASNNSKKVKLVISIFASLVSSFFAIWFQFFEPEENDYKIRIKTTKSVISMQSILSCSWEIITIFFWKQVINTIRKNATAVSLTCSPNIIWIDSNGNNKNKAEYKEKKDTTKGIEIHYDDKTEEVNTEYVLKKPQENRESFSCAMQDEEMKEMEKTWNELTENCQSTEEQQNKGND